MQLTETVAEWEPLVVVHYTLLASHNSGLMDVILPLVYIIALD